MAQPCDVALNQHVRRLYTAREVEMLTEKMRDGVKVPRLSEEQRIDLMAEVMSSKELHLRAAESYKEIGFKVALDGSHEDIFIVREAGQAWRRLGMRAKIETEIERVRTEAREGRLK